MGEEKRQNQIRSVEDLASKLECSCQSVDQQVHDFRRTLSRCSGKKNGLLRGYDYIRLLSSSEINLAISV